MGRYAANTAVPIERTRTEIERTLMRYGARAFSYGWDGQRAVIMFEADDRRIRFDIEMPHIGNYLHTPTGLRRSTGAAEDFRDKAVRQRWRALLLIIKAKLEAVESGIVSFEDEFLAHIMLPDGSKVGQWMAPQLQEVYETGQMPDLLPPARLALEAGVEE